MRLLKIIIFILVVGFITYGFKTGTIDALYNQAFRGLKSSLSKGASQVIQIEKIKELQVSLPGPLFKLPPDLGVVDTDPNSGASASISIAGIEEATNKARKDNGNLPPLKHNDKLTASALLKLNDLFAKQYFEHTSPTGVVLADLVTEAEYDYVVIGENLALGDFASSQEFVTEWMNSPGHRANILNQKYEEIGVAVSLGTYNGQQVWIAVQHFGKPLSSCPIVNESLRVEIESLESNLTIKRSELEALKREVDESSEFSPSYSEKVEAYNTLAGEFNNLLVSLDKKIAQYNANVKSFNQCIEGR